MPSPFPGMDPYLEANTIWAGFHHALPEEIKAQLNAQIGPKYYADVEVHTVFDEVNVATKPLTVYPDVGVLEPVVAGQIPEYATPPGAIAPAPIQRAIEISQVKLRSVNVYVTETDTLVTAIEILSPYNKRGAGLTTYRNKRSTLLSADVHLVEIDLLRGGRRPGREADDPELDDADYLLLVNRHMAESPQRVSEIWPVSLNEALPILPIPLLPPDPDVPLDLHAAIAFIYERSGYAWRINYREPVPPPQLRPEMAEWVGRLLTR